MSSGMGTTLANQVLNYTLGVETYTPPSTVYVALYLVAPTASGGGVEVTASGYERLAVANTTSEWPTTTTGTKANANALTFSSAAANWGTVVGAALLDSPVSTVPMFYGTLDTARPIFSGDTPLFPDGTFRISLA